MAAAAHLEVAAEAGLTQAADALKSLHPSLPPATTDQIAAHKANLQAFPWTGQ